MTPTPLDALMARWEATAANALSKPYANTLRACIGELAPIAVVVNGDIIAADIERKNLAAELATLAAEQRAREEEAEKSALAIMVELGPLVADAAIVGRTYGWPQVLNIVMSAKGKVLSLKQRAETAEAELDTWKQRYDDRVTACFESATQLSDMESARDAAREDAKVSDNWRRFAEEDRDAALARVGELERALGGVRSTSRGGAGKPCWCELSYDITNGHSLKCRTATAALTAAPVQASQRVVLRPAVPAPINSHEVDDSIAPSLPVQARKDRNNES